MIKHAIVSVAAAISLLAQSPVRGIPGATQQQTAALTRMNSDIAPQVNSLTEARSAGRRNSRWPARARTLFKTSNPPPIN
jgi:hypothetical protein